MIKIVDPSDLEVLTEWCRNKPEDAAIQILAMKAQTKDSENESGSFCQCGLWIPRNVT